MPEHDERQEPITDETIVEIALPAALSFRAASDDDGGLLAKAKARAGDPAILSEHPPVFFTVRASDNTIDSYFTRMMPSTLRNYAADAADGKGVPFLDSHRSETIGRILGRSLDGRYVNGQGDDGKRVDLTFYTQPTLRDEMRAFVDLARGGYASDVSVGFYGGRMVCSICGGEMLRWWRSRDKKPCYHIPGMEYGVVDESGTETGDRVVAIGLIEDARLGETSTVHKGSNPNAGFIGFKARQLHDAGLLLPEVRSAVVERYGLHLPGGRNWPGADTTPKEEPMDPKKDQQADVVARADHDRLVADAVKAEGERYQALIARAFEDAGCPVEEGTGWRDALVALGGEVRRLRPLADDGKKYRAHLIDEALKEGVRAYGKDEFDEEQERAELETLSLDGVKRRIKLYQTTAEKFFQGGRQTREGDDAVRPITSGNRNRAFRA